MSRGSTRRGPRRPLRRAPRLGVAALLLLAMALAAETADGQGTPFGPGARWFELEVPDRGESPWLPIAPDELAALLVAHGFQGVLFRLPPAPSERTPAPPHIATEEDKATYAPLLAPFARDLICALAHRDVATIAALPPWPAVAAATEIGIAADRPAIALRSAQRPAVRRHLWRAAALPAADAALLLSSRLLLPTAPELRALQLRLDLASFGHRPLAPVQNGLLRQSALADAVAQQLGGDAPELLDPLENTASETAAHGPLAPLRRAPAELDDEEWLFSYGRDGALFFARLPWHPAEVRFADAVADYAFPRLALPASADEPAAPGILSDREFTSRADQLDACFRAAAELAERLTGIPLAPSPRSVDRAPDETAGPEAAAPPPLHDRWRLHAREWEVRTRAADGAGSAVRRVVRLARVDDPRLGSFAAAVEQALGAAPFDLSRDVPLATGGSVVLSTTLALRDPAFARLRLAADASCTVVVDGHRVVDRFRDAAALLTTLPLPAGTSTLTIELEFAALAGQRRVDLALDLLPQRAAAVVLGAAEATEVREPAVRIADAGALEGVSLVRPLGRDVAGPGDAFLPFRLARAEQLDLWLHLLVADAAGGAIRCAIDDGTPLRVPLPPGNGWQWRRVDAPFALPAGDHALRLVLESPGLRVDQAAWLRSEVTFPRPPPGGLPLWSHAWRFDPLGAGVVVDLPPLTPGELFPRSFVLDKSGNYQLHAWLKGDDPLQPGERAEIELTAASARLRLLLPAGTPCEEWIALGDVALTAGERVELRVRGDGSLARIALVR